jgi:hypothetical protein
MVISNPFSMLQLFLCPTLEYSVTQAVGEYSNRPICQMLLHICKGSTGRAGDRDL